MMRAHLSGVAVLIGLSLSSLANAQPADSEAAPMCTPDCAPNELCSPTATCVSKCNPVCADNEICSPAGACVSRCNPVCAANELCTAGGSCVSRCNPACGEGQTCEPNGDCTGGAVAGSDGTDGPMADPGWARKAGGIGIATAIIVGLLTTGIVIADDEDIGLALGIPATLIGGIMIPIVARGGESARKHPGVVGSPGLRRTGWIAYSGALIDAVILIGLAFADAAAPAPLAGTVGLLGVISAVSFTVDAYRSANQATEIAEGGRPATAWSPSLLFGRDRARHLVAMPGMAWSF